MANLTREQVKEIINKAPAGTTPEGVVSALRAQGHTLEGYPSPQQEKKANELVTRTERKKNVLQKAGDFLGISKFGEGVGTAVSNITGGLKPLEETFTALERQSTNLMQQYKDARDSGDTTRAKRLLTQLQEVNQTMQATATALGDAGTGGLSNKEFLGSAALTLGNVALAGAGTQGTALKGSIGATAGQAVKSAVPAISAPIVRNAGATAYLKSLGANVAKSAVVGGAFGAASGAEQDENILRAAGIGLLIGGAIPPALEVGRLAVKGVQTGSRLLAQTFARTPSKAIDYAIQNPEGTRAGIQRAIKDEKTVFKVANAANKAAGNIEAKRNSAFSKGLQKIEGQMKGKPIDPTPFNERLRESLRRFDVITPDGRLNPESVISDPRELKDIQGVLDRMRNTKNLTPEGWWKLKRFVDNKYRPTASGEYNALVTDMSQGLREALVDNVKGFDKLLSRYEAESTLLTFLKKELGVTGRARGVEVGADDAVLIQDNTKRVVNALRRAMSENQPLANELVNELQRVGGKEIMDDLVGMYFASWLPPAGLQTFLGLGAGSAAAVLGGVGTAIKAAPLAAFGSPRLVGEGAALYGQVTQGLRNVSPQLAELLKGAGRQATFGGGVRSLTE